jgi:hypothetical protein
MCVEVIITDTTKERERTTRPRVLLILRAVVIYYSIIVCEISRHQCSDARIIRRSRI